MLAKMVRQCHVCKKSTYWEPGLSLHRFPRSPTLRKKWFSLLSFDENRKLPTSALICVHHFTENDFTVKPSGLKHIKATALPLPFNSQNDSESSDSIETLDSEASGVQSREEEKPTERIQKTPSVTSTALSVEPLPTSETLLAEAAEAERLLAASVMASDRPAEIISKFLHRQHNQRSAILAKAGHPVSPPTLPIICDVRTVVEEDPAEDGAPISSSSSTISAPETELWSSSPLHDQDVLMDPLGVKEEEEGEEEADKEGELYESEGFRNSVIVKKEPSGENVVRRKSTIAAGAPVHHRWDEDKHFGTLGLRIRDLQAGIGRLKDKVRCLKVLAETETLAVKNESDVS